MELIVCFQAVAIPHYSVIANCIQTAVHQKKKYQPGDVATAGEGFLFCNIFTDVLDFIVLPFFHIYGLVVNLHFMLFSGVTLVVIERFSFVEFLKSITRHRIMHLFTVPPHMLLFCKHPAVKDFDLSHVKSCIFGAAPLSAELTQQFIQTLPNCSIGQGYGLTETCTTISFMPPQHKVGTVGSAGELLPGIEARVVKADGQLAGRGESGELVVRGPSMALGYLNNEKAFVGNFCGETFVTDFVPQDERDI
jgi:acyl-CoA synthetase (AMP-forming)/AMP-acid ligase II